jgi:hypothetical protein
MGVESKEHFEVSNILIFIQDSNNYNEKSRADDDFTALYPLPTTGLGLVTRRSS